MLTFLLLIKFERLQSQFPCFCNDAGLLFPLVPGNVRRTGHLVSKILIVLLAVFGVQKFNFPYRLLFVRGGCKTENIRTNLE